MMLGSKGILPPMIPGLLRAIRSRNPQNIRNPLIFLRKMATYSCFGPWDPGIIRLDDVYFLNQGAENAPCKKKSEVAGRAAVSCRTLAL